MLKDENLLIEEILADKSKCVYQSGILGTGKQKNPNLFQRIIQIVRDFFKKFKRLEVNNYLTTEQIERFEKDFETIVTTIRGRVEAGEKRPATATTRYTAREVERKPVPPFFSKLQQVITEKMPNAANASDVRNLVNKSGIKADEIKWAG